MSRHHLASPRLTVFAVWIAIGSTSCSLIAGIGDHDPPPASSQGRGGGGASSVSTSDSSTATVSTATSSTSSSTSSTGGGGSGGGLAFPSTPVLDDFNRADGALGPAWNLLVGGAYGVAANAMAAGGVTTPDAATWLGTFGADQEAFVTLADFTPQCVEVEVLLKHQGSAGECDSLIVDYHPYSHTFEMYTCATDTFVMVVTQQRTLMPGDQIGGRAEANGRFRGYINGAVVADVDVGNWAFHANGGAIGVYSDKPMGTLRLDDFGGGDLP